VIGGRSPRFASLVVVLVAACGSRNDEMSVHGVRVVLKTSAPFTRSADFPARLENTVDAALQFWDGRWDALAGTTIVLDNEQYLSCGSSSSHALGCFDGSNIHVTTRDPTIGTWLCVEQTVLVHEIGHAIIGDPMHDDPRWMDFMPVFWELQGRDGYDANGGVVPCQLYLNVWWHPLHQP